MVATDESACMVAHLSNCVFVFTLQKIIYFYQVVMTVILFVFLQSLIHLWFTSILLCEPVARSKGEISQQIYIYMLYNAWDVLFHLRYPSCLSKIEIYLFLLFGSLSLKSVFLLEKSSCRKTSSPITSFIHILPHRST